MSEAILKVDKLVKDYGQYRAVAGISFDIKHGQVLGLLGPNGAGKTTTIQMLLGITKPSSGNIYYFGRNFAKQPQTCLQQINFTSAYNTLQGRISVMENLKTFAGLYQTQNPVQKIESLLDRFSMSRFAKTLYVNLSAGERTRINLIKSLLNDPQLILMDEPTASLDPDIADKTLEWIEELRANNNLSILFTSHNMTEVERICDDVIFLDKGKIVSRGSPSDHTSKISDVQLRLMYKGDQNVLRELMDERKLKYEFIDREIVIETKKHKTAAIIVAVAQSGVQIVDTDIKKPDLEQVFLEIARGNNK